MFIPSSSLHDDSLELLTAFELIDPELLRGSKLSTDPAKLTELPGSQSYRKKEQIITTVGTPEIKQMESSPK